MKTSFRIITASPDPGSRMFTRLIPPDSRLAPADLLIHVRIR